MRTSTNAYAKLPWKILKKMQNLFKYQIFHMILYEIDGNVIYDEHIYNIISTKEQKL